MGHLRYLVSIAGVLMICLNLCIAFPMWYGHPIVIGGRRNLYWCYFTFFVHVYVCINLCLCCLLADGFLSPSFPDPIVKILNAAVVCCARFRYFKWLLWYINWREKEMSPSNWLYSSSELQRTIPFASWNRTGQFRNWYRGIRSHSWCIVAISSWTFTCCVWREPPSKAIPHVFTRIAVRWTLRQR